MLWFDARAVFVAPHVSVPGLVSRAIDRPSLMLTPRKLFHERMKTASLFDSMSKAVARFVMDVEAPYVLQTQGLFNAAVRGRPLYIYTDYTELANLRCNPNYPLLPKRWLRRERALYERADLLFAGSRATAESFIEDYEISSDRVVLVETGLNVLPPPSLPTRDSRALDILFVGIDWERKGGPDLVVAYKAVKREISSATLTIVGCRPSVPAGLDIRVMGKLSPPEVAEEFRLANLFCLPALQEPAGIAYSEASAWGLAVVATTAGNIPGRVISGRTGLLVEPGDHVQLTDALLALAADPDRRHAMGQAGRDYTLKNFTWSHVARQIHSSVVGSSGRSTSATDSLRPQSADGYQ